MRQLAGARGKVASKLADSSPLSGTAPPRGFLLRGVFFPQDWAVGVGAAGGVATWVWRKQRKALASMHT